MLWLIMGSQCKYLHKSVVEELMIIQFFQASQFIVTIHKIPILHKILEQNEWCLLRFKSSIFSGFIRLGTIFRFIVCRRQTLN